MGKRYDDPAFLIGPPRPKQPTPSRAKPAKALPKVRSKPRVTDGGKVLAGQKLVRIVTDPDYIVDLRDEPCEFTGLHASPDDPVEAMHIGNPGKGLKNDAEALPARHSVHALTHTKAGICGLLPFFERNPHLLIAVLRAYARERYERAHSNDAEGARAAASTTPKP